MANHKVQTLDEFITKHGLKKYGTASLKSSTSTDWHPVILTDPDNEKDKEMWSLDEFEFLGNSDRTLVVSVNATRRLFRIVFNELTTISSRWIPMDAKYLIEPL